MVTPATRLLLAAAALGAVGWAGCRRQRPSPAPPAPRQQVDAPKETGKQRLGRITLRGSTLTGADAQGHVLWRAKAKSIDLDEEGRRASLNQVRCTFLEANKPVSQFSAGKMTAYFSEGARRLQFSESVRAESLLSQAVAKFGQVTYLWDEHRIVNAKPVEFTKGASRLTGALLEGDVALRHVEVSGAPAALLIR